MSWGAGLRAAEFLLCLLFLYIGFFLYETEEGLSGWNEHCTEVREALNQNWNFRGGGNNAGY
jgi:hypothetical protein